MKKKEEYFARLGLEKREKVEGADFSGAESDHREGGSEDQKEEGEGAGEGEADRERSGHRQGEEGQGQGLGS